MRRRVFIPLLLLSLAAAAALLGACKATDTAGNTSAGAAKAAGKPSAGAPPTGTTEVHADGVRRVTVAELQTMLEDGRTVVYDTRAKASYDAEHIKGALSMPYDEVANRAGELPKDKTLVFYCT
jgi:hypothetical protein